MSEGNDTSIVEYFYQLQGSVQGASSAGHFSLQNGPAIGVVWPHFIDEKSQAQSGLEGVYESPRASGLPLSFILLHGLCDLEKTFHKVDKRTDNATIY